MEFLLPIALGLIIILLIFLLFKSGRTASPDNALQNENQRLQIDLARAGQQIKSTEEEKVRLTQLLKEEKQDSEFKLLAQIERLEDERKQLAASLAEAQQQLASAKTSFEAQEQKFKDQQQYLLELQQRFKVEFEQVANQVLKEKTKEFTETNRSNLDILLNPLKENIKAFEEKIDKSYKAESAERFTLKGSIEELVKQTRLIQEDANNLSKALKGDNKKQGNWGEMVLDRLLEGSGLIEGLNYTRQVSFVSQDGGRNLPDVVVNLPENKHLIIDSKVSLVAYEKLVSCEDETEKDLCIRQHLLSIKNHIQNLGAKNYQDLYQINSPEFVLLFIPIESSFALALQHDRELFDYAWSRKVVIVTPSTLLATLKTVSSIWKQEQQTRNAIEIATKAGALYDKFVGFIEDLNKVGDGLNRSQKAYHDAFNKLSVGNGNIVGRIEHLKKLGAKANKQIDGGLLEE